MASKRMTANPVKPARYRPGKPVADEPSSSSEEESGEEDEVQNKSQTKTLPPKATSFPSDAAKIANNLKRVNLDERRRQTAAEEALREQAERAARAKEEEDFETESGSEEAASESGSSTEASDSDQDNESSESDSPAPKLIRPTFIKKSARQTGTTSTADTATSDPQDQAISQEDEQARRLAATDNLLKDHLQARASALAVSKKQWDDDEDLDGTDQVDDTDDLDPEAEYAAWKLRELTRVKRARQAIEAAEAEREEVERRRNLSKEEREAEDAAHLAAQKEEKEGKGKVGFMQKYYHKGAFFQSGDGEAESLLKNRDIMGARYADEIKNRELLPEYMQIRDMTRLGKKSRTKYKDLRTEDTGRWGQFDAGRKRDGGGMGVDERFQPDRDRAGGGGRLGPSGANATMVSRDRRTTAPENAPLGPKGGRDITDRKDEDRVNNNDRRDERRRPSPTKRRSYTRSRSRSRTPPPRRSRFDDRGGRSKRGSVERRRSRLRSWSRSRSRSRERRRSYSRSPVRRSRYRDDEYRSRRKRSPSPYYDRRDGDKRRKVNVY